MFDIDKYKEIWQTISRNKMRSFLTGFGVSWGIFLFVVMFGAGTGMQKGLTDALGENISNSFFMMPERTTMPYKGFNANRSWHFSNADLPLIMQTIPEVTYLSGMLFDEAGKVAHSDKSGSYMFRGVDPDYFKIEIVQLTDGRTFNRIDMDEKRKVCVIGKRVREELFEADENPVGQQLLINGIAYYLVGIIEGSDISFMGRADLSVFVPLTTMQQIRNAGDVIHMFMGVFAPNIDIALVEKKVQTLLKKQHSIAPEDNDAMVSLNLHDYFMMFDNLFTGIKILVWIVGMGTLLAGAVGISNIMLVSIRERTGEIGIRRALGAKPQTILRQIMGESILLTCAAGYCGFLMGIIVLEGMNKIMQLSTNGIFNFNMQISFGTSLLAFSILLVAGMTAGIIPAVNALKIKAIDALRDN